jgi:hypothetical protein
VQAAKPADRVVIVMIVRERSGSGSALGTTLHSDRTTRAEIG